MMSHIIGVLKKFNSDNCFLHFIMFNIRFFKAAGGGNFTVKVLRCQAYDFSLWKLRARWIVV